MLRELLLTEITLKLAAGGLLALFPRTVAQLLGLHRVAETFWPRLLGALLVGLGAATALEHIGASQNGLGLAGHVVLNLLGALMLFALLVLGRAAPTRRGRILVGLAAAILSLLAMVELAWA